MKNLKRAKISVIISFVAFFLVLSIEPTEDSRHLELIGHAIALPCVLVSLIWVRNAQTKIKNLK